MQVSAVAAPTLIGGVFGLDLSVAGRAPPFIKGGEWLLVNTRSALAWLVESLCPTRVWVPSYLCGSLIEALQFQGVAATFFPISRHLEPQPGPWLEQIRERDLVVAIDYFGFPCPPWFFEQVRQKGAWTVEDASQALLTAEVGQRADFVLYSPRQFVGVPDGGILRQNTKLSVRKPATEPPPAVWWLTSLQATMLRAEFDRHGGERSWLPLFQEVEKHAPIGPFGMSELSRLVLGQACDYERIALRRRENYQELLADLPELAVFKVLPDGVVPLGFPIRVPNRDRLQQRLFAEEIYPSIHWPLNGVVPPLFEASHRLANEMLTLPCDQRYEIADMERIVQAVRTALLS